MSNKIQDVAPLQESEFWRSLRSNFPEPKVECSQVCQIHPNDIIKSLDPKQKPSKRNLVWKKTKLALFFLKECYFNQKSYKLPIKTKLFKENKDSFLAFSDIKFLL